MQEQIQGGKPELRGEARSQHQTESEQVREESTRRIAEEDARTRREQIAMRQQAPRNRSTPLGRSGAIRTHARRRISATVPRAKRQEAEKQIDTKVTDTELQADTELTRAETEAQKERSRR